VNCKKNDSKILHLEWSIACSSSKFTERQLQVDFDPTGVECTGLSHSQV